VFEYRLARDVHEAFTRRGVKYLFIGKSGAILLGYPDTTQDADLFPQKSQENGRALVAALEELGFALSDQRKEEIIRGKDFVQLRNGPFDLDLVFAPDGIETFEEAWEKHVEVDGMPVCHLDEIIASKLAAGREKDLESLPRLIDFRDFWQQQQR
jgi:hypothetical protein